MATTTLLGALGYNGTSIPAQWGAQQQESATPGGLSGILGGLSALQYPTAKTITLWRVNEKVEVSERSLISNSIDRLRLKVSRWLNKE